MDEPREPVTAEQLLARGEHRAAIERAIDQYGRRLYHLCRRILRDEALAEDAMQDVFLQAYRDIRKLEDPARLWQWLAGIAAHRALDRIERRNKDRDRHEPDDEVVERVADRSDGPRERLSGAKLHEALLGCLDELSALVRTSLMMRYFSELSYDEMAAATNTKVDAHTARVARALPVLRRCLEGKGWSHG